MSKIIIFNLFVVLAMYGAYVEAMNRSLVMQSSKRTLSNVCEKQLQRIGGQTRGIKTQPSNFFVKARSSIDDSRSAREASQRPLIHAAFGAVAGVANITAYVLGGAVAGAIVTVATPVECGLGGLFVAGGGIIGVISGFGPAFTVGHIPGVIGYTAALLMAAKKYKSNTCEKDKEREFMH